MASNVDSVKVEISVVLGRSVIPMHQLLRMGRGAVIELDTNQDDPVLILARSSGFGWPTVKAIIAARPGAKATAQVLDAAFDNFERLTAATAQRVVRFWQVRQGTGD